MKTPSGTHMTQEIPSRSSVSMDDIMANLFWNTSLPFSPCLSFSLWSHTHYLTLSLHLLFPFLNLKGDCVYSIFIILGGTVDRWDTCTITRAQHYLFQADRVKNTLSSPSHHLSLSSERVILYYEDISCSGQEVQSRPINKETTTVHMTHRYDLFLTTENNPPCENQGLCFMHFAHV